MDYKDKIKEILEDKTIPEEQRKKLEEILSTAEKSEDERIRNALITHCRNTRCVTEEGAEMIAKWIAWLEKQSNKPKQKSIWKHWKDGIAGNGEGEPIYLVKNGNTYSLNSCLGCECDYIELSELDKLMLEKQGEQKPVDKAEPKFEVGDWINGYYTNYKVTAINSEGYVVEDTDGNKLNILFENEKFHHLFTIADAKEGDVLDANGAPFIYKKHDKDYVYFYCGINLAGEFIEAKGFDTWNNNYKVYPATKEQRDLLFSKMHEEGYKWDDEHKELKKIETIYIPFSAKDSELIETTYFIPKGFHAEIENDKVIIKKGEQKPADKVGPKFHKGDWIIHQGTENICQVVAHIDNQYQLKYGDNYTVLKCADVDRCARLWDITKDAKEGDVLVTADCVFIFKKLNARGKPVCYCHYDDELGFKVDVNSYLATGSEIYPATIERRNILMKAMADAGYEWDSEKKELKEIEQEPAWSVKDEAGLGDALWAIQQARTIAKDETDMGNLWYAENWLNSLKERLLKS